MGQMFTFTYDAVNRQVAVEFPDAPGAPANTVVMAGYDNNHNGDLTDDLDDLASVTNPNSTVTFLTDAFGRIASTSTTASPISLT